jgi:hypothetical protein
MTLEARGAIESALSAEPVRRIIELVGSRLPQSSQLMVQGGFLRNVVLQSQLGISVRQRDLDFVVGGIDSDEQLAHLFRHDHAHRTTFGGVKLLLQDVKVDIWRAELQMRVAGHQPYTCPLTEILQYVTLTTDAVGYDPAACELHECGFLRAMQDREIDAGPKSIWLLKWLPFHVAHLTFVRSITGFSLSDEIVSRLKTSLTPPVLGQAAEYLRNRKGEPRAEELVHALRRDIER